MHSQELPPLTSVTAHFYAPSRTAFLGWVLVVLTAGIAGLVAVWRPRFRLWLFYRSAPPSRATVAFIDDHSTPTVRQSLVNITADTSGSSGSGSDGSGDNGDDGVRVMIYEQVRFVLEAGGRLFTHPVPKVAVQKTGLSERQVAAQRTLFGRNCTAIPPQSIISICLEQIFSPFYLFQIFSFTLWYCNEYSLYATVILLTTVFSVATEVYNIRSAQRKLYNLGHSVGTVHVRRGDRTLTISIEDLVPGDLVILEPGPAPADIFLTSGEAVVDESLLTGESVPVFKVAPAPAALIALSYEAGSLLEPTDVPAHALVAAGTTVSLTRGVTEGVVVATGFLSQRGELIRSIMHPQPNKFKFQEDSLKYIGVFCILAFLGFACLIYPMILSGVETSEVVLRALDIITVAVPPALPACMSIGVTAATRRLAKKNVLTINSDSINVAGVANQLVADKTGTLTTDNLELVGVCNAHDGCWDSREGADVRAECALPEMTSPSATLSDVAYITAPEDRAPDAAATAAPALRRALLCCHGLYVYEGNYVGDPLDLAMFNATNATIWEDVSTENLDRTAAPPAAPVESSSDLDLSSDYIPLATAPLAGLPVDAAVPVMAGVIDPLDVLEASSGSGTTDSLDRLEVTDDGTPAPTARPEKQSRRRALSAAVAVASAFSDPHMVGAGTGAGLAGETSLVGETSTSDGLSTLDSATNGTLSDVDVSSDGGVCARPPSPVAPTRDARDASDLDTVLETFIEPSQRAVSPGAGCSLHSALAPALERGSLVVVDSHPGALPLVVAARYAFTSDAQRATSVVVETQRSRTGALIPGRAFVTVKGASERVLALCDPTSVPDDVDDVLAAISRRGYRVLVAAERILSTGTALAAALDSRDAAEAADVYVETCPTCGADVFGAACENCGEVFGGAVFTFAGLIVFDNPPRPDSRRVVRTLRRANVRTTMCTGDSAGTAVAIAHMVKIMTHSIPVFVGELADDYDNEPASTREAMLRWPIRWRHRDDVTGEVVELPEGALPEQGVLTGQAWAALYEQHRLYEAARNHFFDTNNTPVSAAAAAAAAVADETPEAVIRGCTERGISPTETLALAVRAARAAPTRSVTFELAHNSASLLEESSLSDVLAADADVSVLDELAPGGRYSLLASLPSPCERAVEVTPVFARMRPAQKQQLVNVISQREIAERMMNSIADIHRQDVLVTAAATTPLLLPSGHPVPLRRVSRRMPSQTCTESCMMIGDGANDVGALREAGAGVSLSPAEASVAAPFTYALPSIKCVTEIVREGMAALSTSIACFRFMTSYSIIQFTTTSICYSVGSLLSDAGWLFIDLICIFPLSAVMSFARTNEKKLQPTRPQSQLISWPILTSLAAQIVIQVLGQVLAVIIVKHQSFYYPNNGAKDTYESTVTYIVGSFQYLYSAVAFSGGDGFRAPWYCNPWFVLCFVACYVCNILVALQVWSLRELFLHLPLPTWFSWMLIGYGLANGLVTIFADWAITHGFARFEQSKQARLLRERKQRARITAH